MLVALPWLPGSPPVAIDVLLFSFVGMGVAYSTIGDPEVPKSECQERGQ